MAALVMPEDPESTELPPIFTRLARIEDAFHTLLDHQPDDEGSEQLATEVRTLSTRISQELGPDVRRWARVEKSLEELVELIRAKLDLAVAREQEICCRVIQLTGADRPNGHQQPAGPQPPRPPQQPQAPRGGAQ